MTCNCAQPNPGIRMVPPSCRCPKHPGDLPKGTLGFCDICDPCNQAVSTVRLCAFVVPTLEDGRYYKNSFIFSQEDDTSYYISDDRSEIPFGTRPNFVDDFDPTSVTKKNTIVYDVKNKKAYVYGPDGSYMTLTGE